MRGWVGGGRPVWRPPRLSPRRGDPSPSPPLLPGHTAASRDATGDPPRGQPAPPPPPPAASLPCEGGSQIHTKNRGDPTRSREASGPRWGSCPSEGGGRFTGRPPPPRPAWTLRRAPARLGARPADGFAPAARTRPSIPGGRPARHLGGGVSGSTGPPTPPEPQRDPGALQTGEDNKGGAAAQGGGVPARRALRPHPTQAWVTGGPRLPAWGGSPRRREDPAPTWLVLLGTGLPEASCPAT